MMRPGAGLAICALIVLIGCSSTPLPSATASPSPAPTTSPTPSATPAPTTSPTPTSTPGPTATAVPTPTGAQPSPTPHPATGLVVDTALIAGHLDALMAIADQNDGIRAAGTPGYDASADYVAQQMTTLGFQTERQPFDFPFYDETAPVTLTVGDATWSSPEWLHAALYSASGDVEAPLEWVGRESDTNGCDDSDWSAFTSGHVAMVESGGCYTRQKVELAQSAGAVAMISFYPSWEKDQIKRPTLLDPAGVTIPVVAAGRDPWATLADADGATARVSVHGDSHVATVDNVIATLPGTTDRVVMLGGHLDSVLDGPGINDNGSGVATLLALAASIAAQPQAVATIRIGFWSAEEFGDLGSADYVSRLSSDGLSRISAYLNLDMVGSPNPGRFVYDEPTSPTGSDELTQSLLTALEALGAPARALDLGGGSDHFAVGQAGIPVGGVFSGLDPMAPEDAPLFGGIALAPMDPCYHLACDTPDNVDLDSAALLGQAIANVLERLAYAVARLAGG